MKKLETLMKKLYDDADLDFIIDKTIELTDIEFKQTFREYRKAAEYTYNLLKNEGIDAEFITFPADGITPYQDFRTPLAWEANVGRLTVLKSEIPFSDPVVADYNRHPFHLIKGSSATPEGGVKARLLTEEQVLAGEDATGAIVVFPSNKFARSNSISPMLDRGAIGFVSTCIGRGQEKNTPDCIAWCNAATDDHAHWHVQSEDRPFVGFSVSPRTGDMLREACSAGEVEVLVESDGKRYSGEIDAVCGYVKGKSDKEIWLVAHLFEPFLADNSLSVMMSIEIAKQIKKLGVPNYSLRLVFSAETYGLAAVWDYYKNSLRGKVLGAIDIDTPPAFTYDENFDLRFNPYCSPFFGNYMFCACAKVHEKLFPNTEKCVRIHTQFGDDLIIGDPTIGIPTIYYEEDECLNWHSSHWDIKYLEREKVHRSFALSAAWCASVAFLDDETVLRFLPECTEVAKERLLGFAKGGNSDSRMEFFRRGERAQILDFKRVSSIPEIDAAAESLTISPDSKWKFESEALKRAEKMVVSRATEGFPYDLAKIPYAERRALPNGVIYGAFSTILANMDGVKKLSDIIIEAAWENELFSREEDSRNNHFVALSETLIRDYVDAVLYLAKYGYLSIKEN